MNIVISVIALCILWIWVIVHHDTSHFVVRTYELASDKLKKDLTVCLISDLHEKDYGAKNARLAEAIRNGKPDLILSAGDLITCHHKAKDCNDEAAVALVRALSQDIPFLCGMGNHESKLATDTDNYGDTYARYEARISEAGARTLRNETARDVCGAVDVTGFEIDPASYRRFSRSCLDEETLKEAVGVPDPGKYTILIAHDPRHFKTYAAWGADLTVSGHVHGGIARLPGIGGVIAPSFELFPHYDAGEYTLEGNGRHHTMIISCGLGTHTLHVRFNNPGEVCMIKLRGTGAAKAPADLPGKEEAWHSK